MLPAKGQRSSSPILMFLVNKSPPSFFLGGLSYCLKIALDSYFELMIYTHFYTQML